MYVATIFALILLLSDDRSHRHVHACKPITKAVTFCWKWTLCNTDTLK